MAGAELNAALPDSVLINFTVAKFNRKPTFRFHNAPPGNLG
jgi:hypothetical protein